MLELPFNQEHQEKLRVFFEMGRIYSNTDIVVIG